MIFLNKKERRVAIKKIILVSVLMLIFPACTYSQNMINPEGQTIRCSSYGWGIVGGIMAQNIMNECVSSHKQLGYVEIEKVGVPGFHLLEGDPPSILRFQPTDGPAAKAGMLVGDKILEVNGGPIRNVNAVFGSGFGKPGDLVIYKIMRGDRQESFSVILMPKVPPKQ